MILWNKGGKENTEATAQAVAARAKELGIEQVVVASNTGESVRKFLNLGFEVICVSHSIGFYKPGYDEMSAAVRQEFQEMGIKVLTTTHLFRGVNRSVIDSYGGFDPGLVISDTLRLFSQGTKVAVEVAVMALDAGLVPFGRDIISVAGTSRGSDTALVICPAHSGQFMQTKIREIICKPREWER